MEEIDILNPDGSPAGFRLPRKKVHEQGLHHRSIHLWIVDNNGQLLIQKRSRSKKAHPGLWDVSCAGHIEAGDTSESTVIKETREELGIEVKPFEFRYCFTVLTKNIHDSGKYKDKEFIDIYLMIKDIPLENINFDKSEVEDVKYIHLKDLKKLISEKNSEFSPHYDEYSLMFETDDLKTFLDDQKNPNVKEFG